MKTEEAKKLAEMSLEARKLSYAPYSHFNVGAALLTADGRVYTGCNIENAAYGPSVCAERTAFFKAVSEGVRNFTALAVSGGTEGREALDFCAPCGVCRQVMREFCRPDSFEIILTKQTPGEPMELKIFTLAQLLPESFGPENLMI